MLKLMFDLKDEIRTLMAAKDKPVARFNNEDLMYEFISVVGIFTHLNELNVCLQGKSN